jgi:Protein kinase domain
VWSHSRRKGRGDLAQGWKLHVSATVLSACGIFRSIAPYLSRRKVSFKAPGSLIELCKLNAGIFYGFSQVGKFVTVYPRSEEEAVAIAGDLDRLTSGQPAPAVPYDEPLRPGSCVYYRYGQHYSNLTTRVRGKRVPAITRPDGTRTPDRRDPHTAVPPWLADPFRKGRPYPAHEADTPLEKNYGGFEALVQRGRGGIYKALDLSSNPPKPCIIKEGRRNGETDWNGRDGLQRVQVEARFLKSASSASLHLPKVARTFRADGCFYMVMEPVKGRPLNSLIASRERISKARTLRYCLGMATILSEIHSMGWAWLDCKPANFLCGPNGELRAIDFEGACRNERPEFTFLETLGFVPPKRDLSNPQADDLFALGVSFVQLVRRKDAAPKPSLYLGPSAVWNVLPRPFVELTKSLLNKDSKKRPSALATQRILEQALHDD